MILLELARLTRFEHALMLAFAVLIAQAVTLGGLPQPTILVLISLAVPILSEMGAFALNDYLDIGTDRLNKKNDRPLVRGSISPRFALGFAAACTVSSIAVSFFINMPAFIIAAAFNALAVLYNWRLKDLPLAGNAYIATTMAVPFVFGSVSVSETIPPAVVSLALMGFVAGLAREIVKTVQDVDGDVAARGSKTLPVIIGKKPSLAIAVALYIAFIPLSLAPFLLGLRMGAAPLAIVAAADALILAVCVKSWAGDYSFARSASLAAFLAGLAGIMAAAI